MNLKEYKTQLALGTVDFRPTAHETQSSTVLQDIIGRTDDIATLYAVATNPKANIYTLTLLATFPDADEGVIISCAYHPNTTLNILERWMKYPAIAGTQAVQRRVRALQLASGISEKDAWVVDESPAAQGSWTPSDQWNQYKDSVSTVYPSIPLTQKDYVKWTTTGNNNTIEMDDNRFKFASDKDPDTTIYYLYTSSSGVFVE